MTRTRVDSKLLTLIGTVLVAALLAAAGCDSGEDDCSGAECLTPTSDVDAGIYGDLPCAKICDHLYEQCDETPNKLDNQAGPGSYEECILICEGGTDEEGRRCLVDASCDQVSMCAAAAAFAP